MNYDIKLEEALEDTSVACGEAPQTTSMHDEVGKASEYRQRSKAKVGPIDQAKPPVDLSEFDRLGEMFGRIPGIKEREQERSAKLLKTEAAENTEDHRNGSTTVCAVPPAVLGWQAPANLKNDLKNDNPAQVVIFKKIQPSVYTHHNDTKSVVDDTLDARGNENVMTESEYQVAAHECAERLRALAASSGKPVSAVLETVAKDILTPQPKPDRLKWGIDNLPGEHAAAFAKRAYADEYEAGKLTTDLIRKDDVDLANKLLSDKRTPRKWPKEIDIPTGPEWRRRELVKRGGKVEPVRRIIVNRDEVSLHRAARYQAEHPRSVDF